MLTTLERVDQEATPAFESLDQDTYFALRGDFVLKVDGCRPILYPLDNNDTRVMILAPTEGLVLSLLSGRRTLGDVERLYQTFFPDGGPRDVITTISALDALVKRNRTSSGIGKHGLFEYFSSPIESVHHFDPREFVIDPDEYRARLSDYKTKRRLEVPISILCVFTSRCTTNCAYCYADRQLTTKMSLGRWKELVGEMRGLGIRLCALDNGDIFARKDGIDFCETLVENGLHFLLSTKSYVPDESVRRLVACGFTDKVNGLLSRTVQLSIDAVDEARQRRIYGVAPILERTARTLKNFLRHDVPPRIKAVITGLSFDQPRALVDYFYPRGARQFHFVRYNRSFYKHTDELFLTAEQKAEFRRQYKDILDDYPDADCWQDVVPLSPSEGSPAMDRETIWKLRKGCGGGWLSLAISSDGRAFLCEQMRLLDEFVVGNLHRQSIMEVWNSPALLDFIFPPRSKFEGTICHDCDEFEKCMWEQGRCYRDAYFSYGTVYDSPPLCPRNTRPGLRMY